MSDMNTPLNKMEPSPVYYAEATLRDVLTGVAELAGGLKILHSMAEYNNTDGHEAIKIMYEKAHGLVTAVSQVFTRQIMGQM